MTFIVLQQQQNLVRRFGSSKMHLSHLVAWAAVRSKVVVLLLLICCILLLPLCESVFFFANSKTIIKHQKFLVRLVTESEAQDTVVQLKSKTWFST